MFPEVVALIKKLRKKPMAKLAVVIVRISHNIAC